MPDTYGPLEIPVPEPEGTDAVSDPLIDVTLSFFKAVLNANAGAAWRVVAPGEPVVRCTFAHDPEELDFNAKQLPALFLWRDEGKDFNNLQTSDGNFHTSILKGLWVFAPRPQTIQKSRRPILNAIQTILHRAIEQNRDPAWVVQGDTDPRAATIGSNFYAFAKYFSFRLEHVKKAHIQVDYDDGGKAKMWPAVELSIKVIEELGQDLSGLPVTEDTRVDIRLRTSDGNANHDDLDFESFVLP